MRGAVLNGRRGGADAFHSLTPRERETFFLVIEGKTTREAARAMGIGIKTAENHRMRMMGKLGVRNAVEALRYALRHGMA